MPAKLKFDLLNENFDNFFANEIALINDQQKSRLPQDIILRLFRPNGTYNATSTNKFSFIAKLYILWKALNKRVFIVVESEKGIDIPMYDSIRKSKNKRLNEHENSEVLLLDSVFISGSKELCDTFSFMNNLSTSPSYNYLTQSKNTAPIHITAWKRRMGYITRFISNYEAKRKDIVVRKSLSIAQWAVLIYLYDLNKVKSNEIYQIKYRNGYQISQAEIIKANAILQRDGMIERIGEGKALYYKITSIGTDKVNDIFRTMLFNF